jgi:hypothetical protein
VPPTGGAASSSPSLGPHRDEPAPHPGSAPVACSRLLPSLGPRVQAAPLAYLAAAAAPP